MPNSLQILTYHDGQWQQGSVPVIKSADHCTWGGTTVFDGARAYQGLTPDLDLHCARVNRSAEIMGLTPSHDSARIVELALEGLRRFPKDSAVYIRPLYWSVDRGLGFIIPDPQTAEFCLTLEEVPMPPPETSATLTTTQFCRPLLSMATVDAKAACLYPNNIRMMREAQAKGFTNALVADPLGNVAETATSNVFMVKDGAVFTPVPNGTFLNGITRQRHIKLLRAAGITVHESVLTFDDFRQADEVFLSGNLTKITAVTAFDEVRYPIGPITGRARELYWDWAASLPKN
jgi:branched-chain amino acid aminotransferase|tara:strand:- start:3857 stop:4726 length:870 start_codon:yes stop_codon:yes gene_type:complete